MASQIKVEGFKEPRRRASRLEVKLQRRVYNKAVKAGGAIVKKAAVAQAPFRTGTVRKSLVVRSANKPKAGLFGVKITVKGGASASGRSALRRGVGNSYDPDAVERYYRFTELGTKFHPAQPYLKPSLEGSAGEVLRAVKSTLSAGLEREARAL